VGSGYLAPRLHNSELPVPWSLDCLAHPADPVLPFVPRVVWIRARGNYFTYHPPTMAQHTSVQRTAPIAIAPKPPRPEPATFRQDSFHRFEIGPGSLHARGSVESPSMIGSSLPSCQACRFAGIRCTMNDEEDMCSQCQVNGSECSLSSSPASRKRKLNGDSLHDAAGKRRFVFPCPFLLSLTQPWFLPPTQALLCPSSSCSTVFSTRLWRLAQDCS
jgi:hypothetical protein